MDSLKVVVSTVVTGSALLTIGVLMWHAWVSLTTGADVNLVSGVWLALATDLGDGLFYRDLMGPAGFGGTRYFPLFFALIAAFAQAGLDPLAAGYAASLTGAIVLFSGAWMLLTTLGIERRAGFALAVFATAAPYFIHQTIFAIRSEPLAAGLAVWGLAIVADVIRRPERSRWMPAAAAGCFILAIAAKPTGMYAPAAAVAALGLAGRTRVALGVLVLSSAGCALLVWGVDAASDGRFLESLRAGALAGGTPRGLLGPSLVLRPLSLIATSRILTVVFLLAAVALLAARDKWRELPVLALVACAGVTAVALATPGTILTNQIIEPYVLAAVFVGWFFHGRQWAAPWRDGALVLLLFWMAGQNTARIARTSVAESTSGLRAERKTIVERFLSCGGEALAENPLIPVLARQIPVLLDPFALRVVVQQRPEIREELIRRITQRRYSCIVLEYDPSEPRGRGWYRNVHFGWPVIEAILRHYEFRETVGGLRLYAPSGPSTPLSEREQRGGGVDANLRGAVP